MGVRSDIALLRMEARVGTQVMEARVATAHRVALAIRRPVTDLLAVFIEAATEAQDRSLTVRRLVDTPAATAAAVEAIIRLQCNRATEVEPATV